MLRVPRSFGSAEQALAFFASAGGDATDTTFVPRTNPFAHTFVVPALRKLREERGTHGVNDASESKSWATRPELVKTRLSTAVALVLCYA